jgi:hypothetical protein
MDGISAFAFFCEDVRREASGKETLIGVSADIMRFSKFPSKVRRLQVYYRIRFEVGREYNQLIVPTLELDGKLIEAASPAEPFPLDMIRNSVANAAKRKVPYVTAAGRVLLNEPFLINEPCKISAFLNIGDQKLLCGALTFDVRPTTSSASQQPPEQSPLDAPAS